jgi:sarcosine oxidase subunit alpha
MYRLETHPDEWVDRSVVLSFTFEGRQYRGYRGDTISSALAAAGVPYLGRSFKYHRRRHLLSFANHDSNTLFQVDGVPNVRGDVTLLREGMRVSATNTFGGLTRDKARILDRLARWLPVGFYYKAFHTKRLFPRWERMFRALTGLGTVSLDAPRQTSAKRYGFCDVLVLGGGPSGLSAALTAAASGARVALVDEAFRLGGSGIGLHDGEHPATQALVKAVSGSPAITVFRATVAAAYYADHWVPLAEAARLTKMRAKAVVFATGVIAQPAVFRNNDLPGIMLASGAWALLLRYRVAPGRQIVMIAGNLEAYRISLDLHSQGVCVVAIIDLRSGEPRGEEAAAACATLGISILRGHAPYEALPGDDGVVAALKVAPLDTAGRADASRQQRIECDAILMSVGWAAASQLFLQAGGATQF